MPESEISKGELSLSKRLFENNDLNAVLSEAFKKNLIPDSLEIRNILKNESDIWKSTEESTVKKGVIKFKDIHNNTYVIVQNPENGRYGIYEFRYIS
jgi:hypothetical protein